MSFESRRIPHIFTDVLVIGTGAAGLRAAIEAAGHGQVIALTKGEPLDIDFKYIKKKSIQVIPSAMTYSPEDGKFKSDGTRVAWMNANVTVKLNESRADAADRFRNRLMTTYDNDKIRVIPREDRQGNRLSLRRDIGFHYRKAEQIFPQ